MKTETNGFTNGEGLQGEDFPMGESGMTSSIGPTWPPDVSSFNRIKGIDTRGIISDIEGMDNFFEGVKNAQDKAALEGHDVSRVSVRAVMSVDFLRSLSLMKEELPFLLEAIVPLNGTQDVFENSALVYFGHNSEGRQSDPAEAQECRQNYEAAVRRLPLSPTEIIERAKSRGYSLSILSGGDELAADAAMIEQFTALYGYFGWEKKDIVEMLGESGKLFGVAMRDGQIVSAGIAEMTAIPINGNLLRMAEVTEAATLGGHGAMGLYRAVSSVLLGELVERSKRGQFLGGEIDMILGECNGKAPGVLNTAGDQGRTFSGEIGEEFGFPGTGILTQHVTIDGNSERKAAYNDLFPAFMVKSDLYRIYSNS